MSVIQGALLSSQVFDTYLQGGENKLAEFITSVTDGRILCFAIKVSIVRRGTMVVCRVSPVSHCVGHRTRLPFTCSEWERLH